MKSQLLVFMAVVLGATPIVSKNVYDGTAFTHDRDGAVGMTVGEAVPTCERKNIKGRAIAARPTTIVVEKAGTLSSLLSQESMDTITNLALQGEINADDVQVLRYMAGRDERGETSDGQLSVLDMSAVTLKSGGSFYAEGNTLGIDEDDFLPACMFSHCTLLEKVILPRSRKKISFLAFKGCTYLGEVVIHEGYSYIGFSAFAECSQLSNIDIPSSVTTIGSQAFFTCASLKCVNFLGSSELETIGVEAFGRTALTSFTLPPRVRLLPDYAFRECYNLQEFIVPRESALTSIGDRAFMNSNSLSSFVIPEDSRLVSIGEEAFAGGCGSLTTLRLPKRVSHVGAGAFSSRGNPSQTMDSLIITSNLKQIGSNAFTAVRRVCIQSDSEPASLDNASPAILNSENAFVIVPAKAWDAYCAADGWKSFAHQIIPDDGGRKADVSVSARDDGSGLLAAIGEEGAASTMSLTVHGTVNSWDLLLIRNKMPLLHYLDLSDARIVASPQEYYTGCHTEDDRLGANAFRDMKNLLDVRLPDVLKYIGISAFANCTELGRMEIPQGVNTIDDYAFYGCDFLRSVQTHDGLLSIGNSAFAGTGLESIGLTQSLRSIGSYAFAACSRLREILLPDAVRKIEEGTFAQCHRLQRVVLPSQLNTIAPNAFTGCENLAELRIPPMVEVVGDCAFQGCDGLKDVYVYIANANDINIDMNTFSCWNTATLHVPNFSYSLYYWNTQWSQFYRLEEFDEEYQSFYTKNTLALNNKTGKIQGTPDATLYENGSLVVNEDVKQDLDNIEMKSDGGENSASVIGRKEGSIVARHALITINVKANQWHFFCFPFDIPLDSVRYVGDYVWRKYDGAARSRREGGWQDLAADERVLSAGRGYIFQGSASGELVLSVEQPVFRSDDVRTGLEIHPSSSAADASWNFVGNPYTSYFNIDSLAYAAPVTVWTGNGYEAYRPGDDDYSFAPYTAFFVQTPPEESSLGFDAGGRQTQENAVEQVREAKARRARRTPNPGRLLVNLVITSKESDTEEYIDRTRIVFNEQKSEGYESDCDAAKFFSTGRAVDLFTLDSEGNRYAINERPQAGGKVPLGISCHRAGAYQIVARSMDTDVCLLDCKTGSVCDLSAPCDIVLGEGETTARYMIVTRDAATAVREALAGEEHDSPAYDLAGRRVEVKAYRGVMVTQGAKVLK